MITLPNGHTVERPRSRQPLIWICVVAAVWASVVLTGFDFSILIKRGHQFTVILKQIFQPDWSFLPKVIGPLVDTIKMSILGSVLGATLALPFAVVSSTNINRNGIRALNLRDGDELVGVELVESEDELFLVSASGQALHFNEHDVRAMGRAAAGVRGMKLAGVVFGEAELPHARQDLHHRLHRVQRLRRENLQRLQVQQRPRLAGRHVRQQHLADGRAVQGFAPTNARLHAQPEIRFDLVDVDDRVFIQRAQMDGFARQLA